MELVPLALIVLLAFFVEAVVGFGSVVLSITLAAQLYPIASVLPVLVPLNLLLSTYLVVRHHDAVDRRMLLTRMLPFVAAGLPVGLLIFRLGAQDNLKLAFGLFVVALSTGELASSIRRADVAPRPLSKWRGMAALFAGGIAHGLYASGGPLVVYFASREITDKRRFRSTLSALWLAMGAVLALTYGASGLITTVTLRNSAVLLAPVLVGIALGEAAHRRMDDRAFRTGVLVLLLVAGGALVIAARPV